jgi:hypothetical protein
VIREGCRAHALLAHMWNEEIMRELQIPQITEYIYKTIEIGKKTSIR